MSRFIILILLQKNFLRFAVCRKRQSKGLYIDSIFPAWAAMTGGNSLTPLPEPATSSYVAGR